MTAWLEWALPPDYDDDPEHEVDIPWGLVDDRPGGEGRLTGEDNLEEP